MESLIAWMHAVSMHITGLDPVALDGPATGTVCSLGPVKCCDGEGGVGFFGADLHADTIWRSLAPAIPITDCNSAHGRTIISLAGLRAASDLSMLPVPPEYVGKVDLTGCKEDNISFSSLPHWLERTSPLLLDLRGSFISFAVEPEALTQQLLPSHEQHAVAGAKALMCSSYTLRSSPKTLILLDPDQTAFRNCTCAFPWTMTWLSYEPKPSAHCTLEPHFHPLANPYLPIPLVSSVSYDAEHLGITLAIFFTPIIMGGLIVVFFTMLSIYQNFGIGKHIHASRIPGIVTDVFGHPVRAGAPAPDLPSGANLATTPNAITLVVLRLDALGPDGQRHSAQTEGLARAHGKACEKLWTLLTSKKTVWGYFISEFSADQNECVLAFPDARSAVAWSLRLQKDLAGMKFDRELSTWYLTAMHPRAEELLCDPDGQSMYQGILPAIGIHTAPCKQAVLHGVMRQQIIRYRGSLLEISAALAAMAAPGQVLMTYTTYCSLAGSVNDRVLKCSWRRFISNVFSSAKSWKGTPKTDSARSSMRIPSPTVSIRKNSFLGGHSPLPNSPSLGTDQRTQTLSRSSLTIGRNVAGAQQWFSLPCSQFLTHLKQDRRSQDSVLVDMGAHVLKQCNSTQMRIYQVLRPKMVYRLQFYSQYIPDPTLTHELPFTRAPAANEAIHGEILPPVCILFCSPTGVGQVARALEWALSFNNALLMANWPQLLDTIAATRLVIDNGNVMFRGLRAAIGVCADCPSSIVLHSSSGRADYFGVHVNRAARILGGACGGQILCPTDNIHEALGYWGDLRGYDHAGMPSSPSKPADDYVDTVIEANQLPNKEHAGARRSGVDAQAACVRDHGPVATKIGVEHGHASTVIAAGGSTYLLRDHIHVQPAKESVSSSIQAPADIGAASASYGVVDEVLLTADSGCDTDALVATAGERLAAHNSSIAQTHLHAPYKIDSAAEDGETGCTREVSAMQQSFAATSCGGSKAESWNAGYPVNIATSQPISSLQASAACSTGTTSFNIVMHGRPESGGDCDKCTADNVLGSSKDGSRTSNGHITGTLQKEAGEDDSIGHRVIQPGSQEAGFGCLHHAGDGSLCGYTPRDSGSTTCSLMQQADDLEAVLGMMIGQTVLPDHGHSISSWPEVAVSTGNASLTASAWVADRRTLRSHRLNFSNKVDEDYHTNDHSQGHGHPVAESSLNVKRPPPLDITELVLQPAASRDVMGGTSDKPLFLYSDREHNRHSQAQGLSEADPHAEVLIHNAGVFAFKGVGEHVSVSSVCLASLSMREHHFDQSEDSSKVQQVDAGGELQARAFVRVPLPGPSVVPSDKSNIFHTLSGMDADEGYKTNYVDINWT